MAIMSQQMSPEMLTAMLSDPRAQPAQRMAAMNMLNQMKGGAGAPESKMSDSAIMDWNAKRGNTPFADYKPSMADPTQGDGTGAGDMDPSFIRAVQREMQGEQAPQGLPPVQNQQMAQAPQDQGVHGDIAAGVKAASGFAQGGAVRGYAEGGVLRVGRERFINAPGINLDPPQRQTGQNPMFPRLNASDVISGNLGPSVLGRPQVDSEDEDSKYGAMFEDASKKYLESNADETTPEDDRNSALLKFGLGMMTSASKPGATFLGAAGEGGLNAVSEFEKARASRAENRMKKLGLIGNLAEREETRKFQKAELAQKAELKREEFLKDSKIAAERLELLGGNQETINALRLNMAEVAKGNAINQGIMTQLAVADEERKKLQAQKEIDYPTVKDPKGLSALSDKASNDDLGSRQAFSLADRFDAYKPASGLVAGVGNELLKSILGTQDDVSTLRKNYAEFTNSEVMQNLPPGTASDKDVAFALKGFPPDDADAASIASFLRGMGKLKKATSEYNTGRAKFIEETGHTGKSSKDFSYNGVEVKKGDTYSDFSKRLRSNIYDPFYQKQAGGGPGAPAVRQNTGASDTIVGFKPPKNDGSN